MSEPDLFSAQIAETIANSDAEPLASRMRPRKLEEYYGQTHILGEGMLLRRAIEADRIRSIVLYGPPGTGKTTLARIITLHTHSTFVEMNATESTVADIRKVASQSKTRLENGQKTTLFIDEIHRFNKGQQDALLPYVEKGIVRLIGATTENPFFSVNAPLISRSQVFELVPLTHEDLLGVLNDAIKDPERGYGKLKIEASEDALRLFSERSDGDARRALNGLELAVLTTEPNKKGTIEINLAVAEESIQKKAIVYDNTGDAHYNTISAFIKSMRGSDPDATLYWLAKMLEAGEEPRYIARRIVVHAAEDVGLADPTALQTATAAQNAVETIGLPECKLHLSMAALHVCLAPKSNSACAGIGEAIAYVKTERLQDIPRPLRDAHYAGAKILGNGADYDYPHNHTHGYTEQTYMPEKVTFYHPTNRGVEAELNDRLELIRALTAQEAKKARAAQSE